MATSFNAPLKVYSRENATNDGTIAADNSSAVLGVQFESSTAWDGTTRSVNAARIPAGSYLYDFVVNVVAGATAIGAGNVNVNWVPDGGSATVIGTITVNAINANESERAEIVWDATTNNIFENVGSVPGYITFGDSGLAAGTTTNFATFFVTRNADGTLTNTGANLVNE